jgi:hypothetical protein
MVFHLPLQHPCEADWQPLIIGELLEINWILDFPFRTDRIQYVLVHRRCNRKKGLAKLEAFHWPCSGLLGCTA